MPPTKSSPTYYVMSVCFAGDETMKGNVVVLLAMWRWLIHVPLFSCVCFTRVAIITHSSDLLVAPKVYRKTIQKRIRLFRYHFLSPFVCKVAVRGSRKRNQTLSFSALLIIPIYWTDSLARNAIKIKCLVWDRLAIACSNAHAIGLIEIIIFEWLRGHSLFCFSVAQPPLV